MTERQVTVENELGIHARPAAQIIQKANQFRSAVTLAVGDSTADAKSIMSVMMLAAARNTTVTIRANGKDEQDAVAAIAELFRARFNEE
jgi:phosphocarrier protein HPr